MPMPRKTDPAKACAFCGSLLERKRFNGRLEDRSVFLRRKYCGEKCASEAKRQDEVSLPGKRHRTAKAMPLGTSCESCGSRETLQRHHKDQDIENNSRENLQTLCASCHARWHWANGKRANQCA